MAKRKPPIATAAVPAQPLIFTVPGLRILLTNLLAAGLLWVYFQWFHPVFVERMAAVYQTRQPDLGLGLILVCMYPLEIAGLVLKLPTFIHNLDRYPNRSRWGVALGGFLLMGVLVVNAMPSMMLFPALDLEKNMNGLKCLVSIVLFLLVLIGWSLPAGLLGGLWEAISKSQSPQSAMPQSAAELTRPDFTWKGQAWQNLGDLLLTLYGAMAMTANWDFMLAISPPDKSHFPALQVILLIIFVFFYSSSRALYTMEELLTSQPLYMRLVSFGVMGLVALQALAQL